MSKWSSIVQYSCTSIWDLKYTISQNHIRVGVVLVSFDKKSILLVSYFRRWRIVYVLSSQTTVGVFLSRFVVTFRIYNILINFGYQLWTHFVELTGLTVGSNKTLCAVTSIAVYFIDTLSTILTRWTETFVNIWRVKKTMLRATVYCLNVVLHTWYSVRIFAGCVYLSNHWLLVQAWVRPQIPPLVDESDIRFMFTLKINRFLTLIWPGFVSNP